MLLEAAKYGDLLVVGVFSDEDTERILHRRPVLTAAERCAELESLPFVYKVIRGSPSNGISKEFLLEHNIDVCVVPWKKDISNKEFASEIKSGAAIDLYKGACINTTLILVSKTSSYLVLLLFLNLAPREMGIDLRIYREEGLLTSEDVVSRIEKRFNEKKQVDITDQQGHAVVGEVVESNKRPSRKSTKG